MLLVSVRKERYSTNGSRNDREKEIARDVLTVIFMIEGLP